MPRQGGNDEQQSRFLKISTADNTWYRRYCQAISRCDVVFCDFRAPSPCTNAGGDAALHAIVRIPKQMRTRPACGDARSSNVERESAHQRSVQANSSSCVITVFQPSKKPSFSCCSRDASSGCITCAT